MPVIYRLTGEVAVKTDKLAVINCGGVGFSCKTTRNTIADLPRTGQTATLYTHLAVKEDALDLYGFSTQAELSCFQLLVTVSGVGPRNALSILSSYPPDRVLLCIASSDAKSLTAAPGVGQKLANRIVLELKDKIKGLAFGGGQGVSLEDITPAGEDSEVGQAVAALTSLGYTQSEAALAVSKLEQSLPVEELIKGARKALAGRR